MEKKTEPEKPMPSKSEKIGIIEALKRFQADFGGVAKNAANPYFKSKYADLNAVWDAIRGPLTENGLAVSQTGRMEYKITETDDGKTIKEPSQFVLRTTLYHVGGETIASEIPVVVTDPKNPQQWGSALTYFRRYSLCAIVGVSQFDDDGNIAAGVDDKKPSAKEAVKEWQESHPSVKAPEKGEAEKVDHDDFGPVSVGEWKEGKKGKFFWLAGPTKKYFCLGGELKEIAEAALASKSVIRVDYIADEKFNRVIDIKVSEFA